MLLASSNCANYEAHSSRVLARTLPARDMRGGQQERTATAGDGGVLLPQGKGPAQVRGSPMVLHPPLRQAPALRASLPAEVPRWGLRPLQTHR